MIRNGATTLINTDWPQPKLKKKKKKEKLNKQKERKATFPCRLNYNRLLYPIQSCPDLCAPD